MQPGVAGRHSPSVAAIRRRARTDKLATAPSQVFFGSSVARTGGGPGSGDKIRGSIADPGDDK